RDLPRRARRPAALAALRVRAAHRRGRLRRRPPLGGGRGGRPARPRLPRALTRPAGAARGPATHRARRPSRRPAQHGRARCDRRAAAARADRDRSRAAGLVDRRRPRTGAAVSYYASAGDRYRDAIADAIAGGARVADLHAAAGADGLVVRTLLAWPDGALQLEETAARAGVVPTIVD